MPSLPSRELRLIVLLLILLLILNATSTGYALCCLGHPHRLPR